MRRLEIDFPQKDFFVSVFGRDVYVVGGTVRDRVLYGKAALDRDVDLLVTGLGYDQIEARLRGLGKTDTVGRSFAVIKFTRGGRTFDIAAPRRDRKKEGPGRSHRDFEVQSGPGVTQEEDLGRRDFTCNSIAVRLADGRIVDPHRGLRAIAARRVAMTSPASFSDDPLRVLRAARFASTLGFAVDPAVYPRARQAALAELSAERVAEELLRLLLESPRPSLGLEEYRRLGVLDRLFPELAALALTIQDAHFHPERDEQGHHTVWAHSLTTVDVAALLARRRRLDEPRTVALLLAALLHDCGKAVTTSWEFKRGRMTVTSPFHDSRGVAMAGAVLERLRLDSRGGFPLRRAVLKLIQHHHRVFDLYRNRGEITFRAVARAVKDMEGEDLLLLLLDFADRRSRSAKPLAFRGLDAISRWFQARKEEYRINQETIRPLILGRDLLPLGITPGRQMGAFLKRLYELQLDGAFRTREQGLALFRAERKARGEGK